MPLALFSKTGYVVGSYGLRRPDRYFRFFLRPSAQGFSVRGSGLSLGLGEGDSSAAKALARRMGLGLNPG
jgi:hypothetical protein